MKLRKKWRKWRLSGSGMIGWVGLVVDLASRLWASGHGAPRRESKPNQTTQPAAKGAQSFISFLERPSFQEEAENEMEWPAAPQGNYIAAVSSHHQLQSIAGPHCAAIDGIDEWVRAPGRQANQTFKNKWNLFLWGAPQSTHLSLTNQSKTFDWLEWRDWVVAAP